MCASKRLRNRSVSNDLARALMYYILGGIIMYKSLEVRKNAEDQVSDVNLVLCFLMRFQKPILRGIGHASAHPACPPHTYTDALLFCRWSTIFKSK